MATKTKQNKGKQKPDKYVTIAEKRARMLEGILERNRIGLESAIEVLEVAGYTIYQDEKTRRYRVIPPVETLIEEDEEDELPARKGDSLAEYPPMLTIKDVVEITALHEGSVRRLCQNGDIPSTKVGGRIYIPKTVFEQTSDKPNNADQPRKSDS